MSISKPTYPEIIARMKADLYNNLPDLDPNLHGSVIRAMLLSIAGRHFDSSILVDQLEKMLFPNSAEGEWLERWAIYEGLTRLSPSSSSGHITVTGVAGTTVPLGHAFKDDNNVVLITTTAVVLENISFSVLSMQRISGEVVVTTDGAHHFGTGLEVTIAGAAETDYNGTQTITVLSETKFSFEIATTPSTPATGTITVGFTGASIPVESEATGPDVNIDPGATVTPVTQIPDLDQEGYVQVLGLTGGTDLETDKYLRARTLYRRAHPVANFNIAAIIDKATSVPGVTRCFVKRIHPYIGGVTVAFMRDNDPDPFPNAAEVQKVKDAILTILPAQSDAADLFVYSPTAEKIDFTFTNITPETATMKQAITNSLKAFFLDYVYYETNIDEDKYRAAIINTTDPNTGDTLETFTLSSPSGDLTVGANGLGVPGTISFYF